MLWKVIFYVLFAINAAALTALVCVLIQDNLHPFLPIRDEARLTALCLAAWTSIAWALHAGGRQIAALGMAAGGAVAVVGAATGGWFLLIWLPSAL